MLANRERQEATLTVVIGGDEKLYVIKCTAGACEYLEEKLDMPWGQILRTLSEFRVRRITEILHAFLQEYHAKEFPFTKAGHEAVLKVIDGATMKEVLKVINRVVGGEEKTGEGQDTAADTSPLNSAAGNSSS